MGFTTNHIDYLERNHLDTVDLSITIAPGEIVLPVDQSTSIARIHGISKLWTQEDGNINLVRSLMNDVTTGLNGQTSPILYVISGDSTGIRVYMGTCAFSSTDQVGQEFALEASGSLDTLLTSLQGTFPDLEYAKVANEKEFAQLKNHLGTMKYAGLVVGTPTTKVDGQKEGGRQIERLIHGLYGSAWSFMVVAVPIQSREVISLFNRTLNEIRKVQNEQQAAKTANPIDKHYEKLLRIMLAKLDVGKRQGMWHTAAYLLTQDKDVFGQGQSLITSSFGGIKSRPDRIRVLSCQGLIDNLRSFSMVTTRSAQSPGEFQYPFEYLSLQNSEELATFTQIPVDEMPGYFVKDYAKFDVASHFKGKDESIDIGEIIDRGNKMGYLYQMKLKDLDRHGLIIGTTGSGKTNTIFHLIKQIWQKGIPFMVIEPAKTEYRKLLWSELREDVQVFTLGDDTTSPFRLNPFKIMPGVSVQTHIDHLKSVFNASFIMYAPMPYVLERCIHEVYADKGWDLVTNENTRGFHRDAQPTLTDLYRKVDEVVDRLGYEQRITMDVKAALKTRINSLRIGGKGLMLDTKSSIPIETLLRQPTILEIEQIGNDDEKAFVIGLLLTSLYEYYVAGGVKEGTTLTHLTIVEEAHRLFKNIPTSFETETANMQGKSVETFCNMLSEVRAYGEGFLVAEQIPSKLALDIIKNTNLKVMHRIVSLDDRMLVGGTINLDEFQVKRITSLEVGEAAVYCEGDDNSILIKVPYSKIEAENVGRDEENRAIQEKMKKTSEIQDVFIPFESCPVHCKNICKHKKEADEIVEAQEFKEILSGYVLSSVIRDLSLIEQFPKLIQVTNKFRKNGNTDSGILLCTLMTGFNDNFDKRGQQYSWSFNDVSELKKGFIALVNGILNGGCDSALKQPKFSDKQRNEVKAFQDKYKSLCTRRHDSFAGCGKVCPDKLCLYRYHIESLLTDRRLDRNFTNTLAKYAGDDMWKKLGNICEVAERRTITDKAPLEAKNKPALCFAVQKSESMPYVDSFLREKIVTSMVNLFNGK